MGVGEPSLDSDSGVIIPDIPTWLGEDGALRLEKTTVIKSFDGAEEN